MSILLPAYPVRAPEVPITRGTGSRSAADSSAAPGPRRACRRLADFLGDTGVWDHGPYGTAAVAWRTARWKSLRARRKSRGQSSRRRRPSKYSSSSR